MWLYFSSFLFCTQCVSSPGRRPLSRNETAAPQPFLFEIRGAHSRSGASCLSKASKTSASRQVRSRCPKLEKLTCDQLSLYGWHGSQAMSNATLHQQTDYVWLQTMCIDWHMINENFCIMRQSSNKCSRSQCWQFNNGDDREEDEVTVYQERLWQSEIESALLIISCVVLRTLESRGKLGVRVFGRGATDRGGEVR